jgi:HD superfamily phosphodiesterase
MTELKHGLNTQIITQFVRETCEGRPSSHGLEHMQKVHNNALIIHSALPKHTRPSEFHVSLVALLHDVADHKYDHDGVLAGKVSNFLIDHDLSPFPIIQCINAISFSEERKTGKRWFEAMLHPYWVKVRDIVSDADKLEALGVIGGTRCLQYAVEQGHHGRDAVVLLLYHMQDKLLHLRDEYIVTKKGHEMAKPLHDELIVFCMNKSIEWLQVQ